MILLNYVKKMEHQSMGILYENVHEVKASIDEAEKEAMNTIQGQMLNKQRSINTLALVKRPNTNETSHCTNKSLTNLDMSDLRGINRDT